MNLTLAQIAALPSKEENLKKIISVINDLNNSSLVVFPEYCMGFSNSGVNRSFILDNAEDINGHFVTEVATCAKKNDISVLLPIYEKLNNKIFNTAVIIKKGKIKGGYRKIHLFDALGYKESNLFDTGSEAVLFGLNDFFFGIVICYDIRFPELIKSQAKAGADIILVPAAWYKGPAKEEQWQTLMMARAHENTCYIVAVGNAHHKFIGRSVVVDPFGIKNLDLGIGEKIVTYSFDIDIIKKARETLPVLTQSSVNDYKCNIIS